MFKEYDNLSKEELEAEYEKISREYVIYKDQEHALNKIKNKNLWLFFFLPFLALVFYEMIARRRADEPEFQEAMQKVKEKIIYCELRSLYIEKLLKEKFPNETINITLTKKYKYKKNRDKESKVNVKNPIPNDEND